MGIPYVWCVELQAIVDIVEAGHAFREGRSRGKRLNFLCADLKCRMERGGTITGVAYTALPTSHDFKVSAYFRGASLTNHRVGCPFAQEETRKNIEKHDASISRQNLFRQDLLPTYYYLPRRNNDRQRIDNLLPTMDASSSIEPEPTVNEPEPTPTKGFHTTSHFRNIVHAYETYERGGTLREKDLTIYSLGRRSYRDWFRAAKWARCTKDYTIWFGLGRVVKSPSDIYEVASSRQYQDGSRMGRVYFSISCERALRSVAGRFLLEILEEALRTRSPLRFFVLGHASAGIRDRQRDVEMRYHSLLTIHLELQDGRRFGSLLSCRSEED